jgi:hypothetical protein|tara:strand:- start:9740 stop:10111 length:372 start_codon:yes stop_codon:yes gene_type:complete
MLFWVQITLAFVGGIIWHKFWNALVSSGFAIIMLKKTQVECLIMMHHVDVATELALDMKYQYLAKADFSERNLTGEKKLDQHVLNGIRGTMINKLILSVPASYGNIVKYNDWDSAMKFLKENK